MDYQDYWKLVEDKQIDSKGYVKVKTRDGWIHEHRLIYELFIGRKLTKEETIHHIDQCRQNNQLSNLMIFPNQKSHAAFHIKFAKFGFSTPVRLQIQNRWKDYKCYMIQIS